MNAETRLRRGSEPDDAFYAPAMTFHMRNARERSSR
jgi:hypothetical protein